MFALLSVPVNLVMQHTPPHTTQHTHLTLSCTCILFILHVGDTYPLCSIEAFTYLHSALVVCHTLLEPP
jgi:hypothetical protein